LYVLFAQKSSLTDETSPAPPPWSVVSGDLNSGAKHFHSLKGLVSFVLFFDIPVLHRFFVLQQDHYSRRMFRAMSMMYRGRYCDQQQAENVHFSLRFKRRLNTKSKRPDSPRFVFSSFV
jgi:hypothetical protein